MTTQVYLCPTFGVGYQAFTTGGLPLNAGLLYTYIAGGTTPQATYTDSVGNTQNANPIILDADGRTPSEVWLLAGQAYRFDLKDSLGNTLKSYDNVTGINDPSVASPTGLLTNVSGTNTITANVSPVPTAYVTGQKYTLTPAATNTGATTLNISGLGAKNIFASGVACIGGELLLAVPVQLEYDGAQFNVLGGGAAVLKQNASTVADMLVATVASSNTYSSISPPNVPINLTLSCSVAASALTIAIKTRAGSDPTAANPVYVPFRSATAATGDYSWLAITAATSLVVSSGSTLGTTSAVIARLWIVGFNDAGTFRLGIVNCTTVATGGSASQISLRDDVLSSSTAEGGAGGADSAQIIYTGTAVTTKAMRVLGYIEATEGTAGTWATAPSKVQLFGPGVSLPGMPVQCVRSETFAVATGSTTTPNDDTIPQSGEGDQYFSQAVIPSSAANVLRIRLIAWGADSTSQNAIITALFQDSTANAIAATVTRNVAANAETNLILSHAMLAGTTSSTTFKIRVGGASAGTFTLNGNSGSRTMGGVAASSLEIEEVMA